MQDNLNELLKHLPRDKPDAAFVDQFDQELQAQAASLKQKHCMQFKRWVTSCSTLAACLGLLLFLLIPHNNDSFAAMQNILRQSSYMGVKHRLELHVPLVDSTITLSETQSWASREQGIRSDISVFGNLAFVLWQPWEGQTVFINHIHKITTPIDLPDSIDPSELLRLTPANLVQQISHITGKPQRITSEDPSLIGYQIDSHVLQLPENTVVEVWLDQMSKRPTRINCDIPLPNGTHLVWTTDQFTWDPTDAPSQLEPISPIENKITKPLKIPTPSIHTVARSLRNYAALTNGNFPSSQTLPWQGITQIITQSIEHPNQMKAATIVSKKEAAELAQALAGGIYILRAREKGARINYRGEKIKFGDPTELLRIHHPDGRIESLDGNLQLKVLAP